jgi:hypothetical protein
MGFRRGPLQRMIKIQPGGGKPWLGMNGEIGLGKARKIKEEDVCPLIFT